MADAVTSKVLRNSATEYIVRITNISDGTGESNVNKVDASTLVGPDITAATEYFSIDSLEWTIQGMTYVLLEFDATTDDTMAILSGNGYKDYLESTFTDPQSSGETGDIFLTTVGAEATGTYDITLKLIKRQA
jgi:hypothetical protein